MAAVTAAMMGQVKAGDHVVAARALFGSCRWVVEDLLPRFGVGCTLVDGPDLDAMAGGRDARTRRPFCSRRPSNPSLEIIDIAGVAEIAHAAGATLTVDNVFATPLFQTPSRARAPIASSIRPPSTSTARAGVSAASSWPRPTSSRRTCSNSCA